MMLAIMAHAIGTAQAAVILIDFHNTSPSPTLGGTWNAGVAITTSGLSLVDTAGNPTGAALTMNLTGTVLGTGEAQGWDPWPRGNVGWIDANAASDYLFCNGVGTVHITGLTESAYKVEWVAAKGDSGFDIGDYTVNGAFADSTPNGDNFHAYTQGRGNGDYLTWNSVTPIGGTIDLVGTPSSSWVSFNAMRLETVPEPSQWATVAAFLCLGGVGLRRWQRR